jgi:uncharacterized protein (TIGR02996 family)
MTESMPRPDFLTEEYVYRIAPDGKSTQAALKLLGKNAFRNPKWSADGLQLKAQCQGSERTPYKVQVDLGDSAQPQTGCTCDSFKRPCKHALGLLFLAIRSPELFTQGTAAKPSSARQSNVMTVIPRAATDEQQAPADVGQALLQAIFAEPEEDAPRLIYADWLEEQGGPAEQARAEFIRVQIGLARMQEDDPRARGLQACEKELLKKHKARWLKDMPADLPRRSLVFHRGFFEELSCRPEAWVNHAATLFAQHPIYRLRLTVNLDRHRAGLLAVIPQLAHIRVLDLSGCPLEDGPQALHILLATPFFSHLKQLDLCQCQIGTRGLQTLLDMPALAHLQVLDLTANDIGPRGGEILGSSDRTASLKELSLADNPLVDAGARALCRSPYLDGLRRLDLRGVQFGKAAQTALRQRFGQRVLLFSRP